MGTALSLGNAIIALITLFIPIFLSQVKLYGRVQTLESKVNQIEGDVRELNIKQDSIREDIHFIKTVLARIETTLQFLRDKT